MRPTGPSDGHPLEAELRRAWPPDRWSHLTVLAAVSGGPDSVALLRAMVRCSQSPSKGRIVVAHFNHRWRGEASDQDQSFTEQVAASLGLACRVGRADQGGEKESEESARQRRYAFLLETAHKVGARYIALGHTADDQAETILFRLLRGTGLSGLTGMPQLRPLSEATTLVRPLLAVRRRQVLDYLRQLGQTWREDATNAELRLARNRLRHEVLPALQHVSQGDVVDQLVQLGRQAQELLEPVRREAARLLDEAVQAGIDQATVRLDRLAGAARHVVREMFVELWRRQGWPRGQMTAARWQELADIAVDPSPSRSSTFPGAIQAEKQGDRLILRPAHQPKLLQSC